MTVATTTNRESFNGDGVTVAFPYTFKAFEDTDINVVVRSATGVETTLVRDTDFTATVLATTGGTVTLIGPMRRHLRQWVKRSRFIGHSLHTGD